MFLPAVRTATTCLCVFRRTQLIYPILPDMVTCLLLMLMLVASTMYHISGSCFQLKAEVVLKNLRVAIHSVVGGAPLM